MTDVSPGSAVTDHPAVARVRAVLAGHGAGERIVVLDEHARTVFPTTFAELVRITGGTPAGVA